MRAGFDCQYGPIPASNLGPGSSGLQRLAYKNYRRALMAYHSQPWRAPTEQDSKDLAKSIRLMQKAAQYAKGA